MLWKKYLEDLRLFVKDENFTLCSAAEPKQIKELENYLGKEIPEILKQIYLVNDGQPVNTFPVFPDGHEFLPVGDVKLIYSQLLDVARTEASCLWKKEWIPIAQTIGGGVICLDLAGKAGVIQFYPEDEKVKRLADSLSDYLESIIKALEKGKINYFKDDRCFTLK